MGKKISQKNNEILLKQQRTEIEKLRESMPLDALRAAEDKLLAQSIDVVQGLLDFDKLVFKDGEVDEEQLPFEWRLLPPEEKARRIRLAQYGLMNSKATPYGAKLSQAMAVGIMKSRATENSGSKVLNLEISTFPAPAPLESPKEAVDAEFEVIDVD